MLAIPMKEAFCLQILSACQIPIQHTQTSSVALMRLKGSLNFFKYNIGDSSNIEVSDIVVIKRKTTTALPEFALIKTIVYDSGIFFFYY